MGGAPPLPGGFAPQGVKKCKFFAFFCHRGSMPSGGGAEKAPEVEWHRVLHLSEEISSPLGGPAGGRDCPPRPVTMPRVHGSQSLPTLGENIEANASVVAGVSAKEITTQACGVIIDTAKRNRVRDWVRGADCRGRRAEHPTEDRLAARLPEDEVRRCRRLPSYSCHRRNRSESATIPTGSRGLPHPRAPSAPPCLHGTDNITDEDEVRSVRDGRASRPDEVSVYNTRRS